MYNRYDSQMKTILIETIYYEGEVILLLLPWLLCQVEVIALTHSVGILKLVYITIHAHIHVLPVGQWFPPFLREKIIQETSNYFKQHEFY